MVILLIIGLSAISGWLYWAGGHGKPYNSKVRDIGCSACNCLALWLLCRNSAPFWVYCLSFILSWAALSTYYDKLTRLWRKNEDEYAENWFLHGFFIGLAFLPLIFFGLSWWIILLRSIILGVIMMCISVLSKKVFVEEFGRGVAIILTELLFLCK